MLTMATLCFYFTYPGDTASDLVQRRSDAQCSGVAKSKGPREGPPCTGWRYVGLEALPVHAAEEIYTVNLEVDGRVGVVGGIDFDLRDACGGDTYK